MLIVDIEKKLGDFQLRASFNTANEITGLLGASGSGKSLTLQCIAGIITPDKGKIILNDKILFDSEKGINLPAQKRQVGYLFQHFALFPNMNVRKNILCGLVREQDKEKAKRTYDEVITLLQIKRLEKLMPNQISGGEKQRVALARILVNNPKLLMLDEPFSSLDAYLRDKLQIEVKELLLRYNHPVLMVTHSRNEAYHMCSNIGVIDKGNLQKIKKTKELFADPENIMAAEITGCKNIIEAEKLEDYKVYVPQWETTFVVNQKVEDNLKAIGIRAHYFGPKVKVNKYPIVKTGEMEEPFEWIIRFRYKSQKADSKDLWWRIAKDKKTIEMPEELGIAPANIHLLY